MKRCDAEYRSQLSIRITSRNSMYKSNILSNEYIVSIMRKSEFEIGCAPRTRRKARPFSIFDTNREYGKSRESAPKGIQPNSSKNFHEER